MATEPSLVLALNAGSSSVKAAVLKGESQIMTFLAERLGTLESVLHTTTLRNSAAKTHFQQPSMTHEQALQQILQVLREHSLLNNVVAVGHRVVHGGAKFRTSVLVNDATLDAIQSVSHLAPLHNPANVTGIRLMRKILPGIPNVAVFDTSFHATIPAKAYTYPLPPEYRQADMRKFGFHGTSVNYVWQRARSIVSEKKKADNGQDNTSINMVICHLGNGASVTAVSDGMSMDTSMGLTPLAGLMMGTRCGSVDPSIVEYACEKLDKTVAQVSHDMNKNSGLKGMITDGAYDMRSLLAREKHDPEARLAIEMFIYRLGQEVASAMVALNGPMDAIVFTAGIGENSSDIRERAIEQLQPVLQMGLDRCKNAVNGKDSSGIISSENIWPMALVLPTDEEAMISTECLRLVEKEIEDNSGVSEQ